jgi:hypothetical protein
VASVQTAGEIAATLERPHGKRITLLQVLGINSLKPLTPTADDLVGEVIDASEVANRTFTLHAGAHLVIFGLQRTGRVVWMAASEPFRLAAGGMPTVRLTTKEGSVDLSEPAKTKRITVTVRERGE